MGLFKRQNFISNGLIFVFAPLFFLLSFLWVYGVTFTSETYVEMMAHKGTACLVENGSCVAGSEKPIIVAKAYVAPSDDPQRVADIRDHPPLLLILFADNMFRETRGTSIVIREGNIFADNFDMYDPGISNNGVMSDMSVLNADGTETLYQAEAIHAFSYDQAPSPDTLSFVVGGQRKLSQDKASFSIVSSGKGGKYTIKSIEKSIEIKGMPFSGEFTLSDGTTIQLPALPAPL
ncbi:MAG: hypothetical protein HYS44_02045 [Candidatus Niyogibacteria bacterium]|nr:hypothetical protein [Candidatus Niyogibacteria bacterium]